MQLNRHAVGARHYEIRVLMVAKVRTMVHFTRELLLNIEVEVCHGSLSRRRTTAGHK